jgi:hypothetical protein
LELSLPLVDEKRPAQFKKKLSMKTFFYIAITLFDWQNAPVVHLFRPDRQPCLFRSFGGAISNDIW